MMKTFTQRRFWKSLFAVPLAFFGGVVSSNETAAQTNNPGVYCLPQHACWGTTGSVCGNNWNMVIERVTLGTINHAPPQCPNTRTAYTYWNSGPTTTMAQGSIQTITVKGAPTQNLGGWTFAAGAWIDYNRNGVFEASEFLSQMGTFISGGSVTREFTVPCSATPGVTRMRIRYDGFNAFQPTQSCINTYCYGETWDFDVTIAASTAPTADFSVPDTIYTGSPARFVNANPVGYIKHYWDVINVGRTPDDSTINFNYVFPSAGNYQVRLTSINCQGQAVRTRNVTVIDPTSRPRADFVLSQNDVIDDGVTPIFIDFYDLSRFGATSWEWIMTPDFLMNNAPYFWVNPGMNLDQNPQIFAYGVETYDICLIARNARGADTACKFGYLKIRNPSSGPTFTNLMGRNIGSTLDSGVIYDSGGPNNPYGDNEGFRFLIEPCNAEEVTLTFNSFNTAAGDRLTIYDGTTSSSPTLGSYEGTTLPPALTAKSGKMLLVFESNGSGTAPGFEARWKAKVLNLGPLTADFSVGDTVYTCSKGNDVFFKNTTTGIVRGQGTYDWIFEYDQNISYPTGYADIRAEFEPTWTYFQTGRYNVRMTVESCAGSDTVVKSFVLANTSNRPQVNLTVNERILKVGGVAIAEEDTKGACEFQWSVNPSTFKFVNGTSETDRRVAIEFTAPGSYTITLRATNDNGSTTRSLTNIVDVIDYCRPIVGIPTVADIGINKVNFAGIERESSSGLGSGYSDFTSSVQNVTIGSSYQIGIERNSTTNAVDYKVWVDWNRDGDFIDFGEEVAAIFNSTTRTVSAAFTVPGNVVLGESRMRVGVTLAGGSLNSCGPISVGEFEDYTLIIRADDQLPVITLLGQNETIEKNTTYVDAGATAFDNIEGNITSRIITVNTVDESQAGVYFVTYNVSDLSGNRAPEVRRQVTVVEDLTPPTVTLNGANPLIHSVLIPFVDPGVTAIDNPGSRNISNLAVVSGAVNVNAIGDYILTYEVADNFGNTTVIDRTVQVRDITAPVITAAATYDIQVGLPFVNPVTVTDNFDQNVVLTVVSGSINTNAIGTYVVTYSATDASGNSTAPVVVTFNVADFIPPTIHFVPGTDRVIVSVFDANWESRPGMAVTASDNFYGSAQLQVNYPANYSVDVLGTYQITYRATDLAGNTSTWVRTIEVVDNERPVVLTNPANVERWTSFDPKQGVNVKDNYYNPSDFVNNTNGCELLVVRTNVDVNFPGLYQVVYVARDGSGNVSDETTRLVSVSESMMTGLSGLNLENAIKLYPNPSKGEFTIEVAVAVNPTVTIRVVNALGQVVQNFSGAELVNGKLNVNMNAPESGVYFVQFVDGAQVVTKKLVISK